MERLCGQAGRRVSGVTGKFGAGFWGWVAGEAGVGIEPANNGFAIGPADTPKSPENQGFEGILAPPEAFAILRIESRFFA
jgi:hypothetical protein